MNPCITIDVSKECSHVQGFLDDKIHLSKAKKIEHTLEGFSMIYSIRNQIIEKTKIEPVIIFEYTGCYHRTLEAYLESKNYKYIPVPPLVAAKMRKTDIRNAKTDKRDCLTLSKVYYENKLKTFYKGSNFENRLKDIHKSYCKCNDHYQMITVNLLESLDIIFPYFKRLFSEFDSYNALAIFNSTVPGCSKDSFEVDELLSLVEQTLFYKRKMDSYMNELITSIQSSEKSTLQNLLKSIPGIGDNLATRFIVEIKNLDRFKSLKALVAFAGTDSKVSESGKQDGDHLHITKLGNKRLRTILFQMVRGMIKKRIQMSKIKNFYYKKKTQPGIKPKVVLVACINKLLRIIYQMNKSGELYSYQIQQ